MFLPQTQDVGAAGVEAHLEGGFVAEIKIPHRFPRRKVNQRHHEIARAHLDHAVRPPSHAQDAGLRLTGGGHGGIPGVLYLAQGKAGALHLGIIAPGLAEHGTLSALGQHHRVRDVRAELVDDVLGEGLAQDIVLRGREDREDDGAGTEAAHEGLIPPRRSGRPCSPRPGTPAD